MSSAKLQTFVEEVQTIAVEESLVLIADMIKYDSFLSTLSPVIKQQCEKISKSVIGDCLESLPFLSGMKKTQVS